MVRTWSVVLGIGLVVLWIAGLGAANSTPWLTWLDGVAAICAFILAGSVRGASDREMRMGGSFGMAIGLFALWIIGLATSAMAWQSWWTFAFGCAFTLLGIAAASAPSVVRPVSTFTEETREQFRKGA